MEWVEYYINLAEAVSLKSKDRSKKVGVIVTGPDKEIRTTGYNGFPRGMDDKYELWHTRPTKYIVTIHAEENCILNAALTGVSLKGCDMVLNWEPIPCSKCARAIIQAGIKTIAGPNKPFFTAGGGGKDWQEDFKLSKEMLQKAGVNRFVWDGKNLEVAKS